MEISHFSNNIQTEHLEKIYTRGATCDTYRTKIYGKNLFVKRLKSKYAQDVHYREALKKEFEVGFGLEHPNLVRYISFDGNDIYIEFVDGETLTERLKNKPEYFNKRKNCDKSTAR